MLFIIITSSRSSAHTWSMGELSKCCSGPCGLIWRPAWASRRPCSHRQQRTGTHSYGGVPAQASAREVKRGGGEREAEGSRVSPPEADGVVG